MKLIDTILTDAASIAAIRKDIHAHPELCFQEVRTADVVAQQLTDWGIPIHRGMGTTGVVGIVGWRAVQGVAGALMQPASASLVVGSFAPGERGKAMAVWGVGVMVGPILGPTLGGWLTDEQLAMRDRIVFEHCASRQLPVAWNLAGGYQEPLRKVLDIHDRTLRECLRVYDPDGACGFQMARD